MPHFHLNLFNDIDSVDEEGREYDDLAAAKAAAIQGARELMATHVVKGTPLHLSHRMEVTDRTGKVLAIIPFRELITVIDTAD